MEKWEVTVKIRRTPRGKANLHIWREGTAYEIQKGLLFYKEWNNVKFALLPIPPMADVHVQDIRRPLGFPAASFDAVYANHVLEHLTPEEGRKFVGEIHRVLKPGGICRVVVPDLETTCIEYLKALNEAAGDRSAERVQRYRWSVLDLIDQMVRDRSGGLHLELLKSGQFDIEYARYRNGDVFAEFFPPARRVGLKEKIFARTPIQLLYELLRRIKLLLIRGDPRRTREANKWMYDRLSLQLLVEAQGFERFVVKNFAESDIPDWDRYDFDRSNLGDYPLEPSCYVECRKPV
jgi:predicted SAM-dependent methyltransferase